MGIERDEDELDIDLDPNEDENYDENPEDVIDLDNEDDEDSEKSHAEEERAEAKAFREETRRDRGRDADAFKTLSEQNRTLQSQVDSMRTSLGEREEAEDPTQGRIDTVQSQQRSLLERYHSKKPEEWTREDAASMQKQGNDLDEELHELRFDRTAKKRGYEAPQTSAERSRDFNAQRFPEVYGSEEALSYARGLMSRATFKGETADTALHDRVCQETMREFEMGQKPEPTDRERSRFAGESRGGGGSSAPPKKKTFRMDKDKRGLAEALYDDLPPAEAHKKWAREVGQHVK